MTTAQLIKYLRSVVVIQDPDTAGAIDPVYLAMTDADIQLYLEIAMSRVYPSLPSLDYLPNEGVYPVILLAKKELYFALASASAPSYDIGADNNNYLKRSHRFEHYLKMIMQVDKEYDKYLENGGVGGNTLTSSNVLLDRRWNTLRNYEEGYVPTLTVYLGKVSSDSIEISWESDVKQFEEYKVYISTSSIYDPYVPKNPVSSNAITLLDIKDVHQKSCRVTGLNANTEYYILVSVKERTSLTGYCETKVTTLV